MQAVRANEVGKARGNPFLSRRRTTHLVTGKRHFLLRFVNTKGKARLGALKGRVREAGPRRDQCALDDGPKLFLGRLWRERTFQESFIRSGT